MEKVILLQMIIQKNYLIKLMKSLEEFIVEQKGDDIDEQWLNDEKPVMTKDGRQVMITKIDYDKVPNIIKGKVKWNEK